MTNAIYTLMSNTDMTKSYYNCGVSHFKTSSFINTERRTARNPVIDNILNVIHSPMGSPILLSSPKYDKITRPYEHRTIKILVFIH